MAVIISRSLTPVLGRLKTNQARSYKFLYLIAREVGKPCRASDLPGSAQQKTARRPFLTESH